MGCSYFSKTGHFSVPKPSLGTMDMSSENWMYGHLNYNTLALMHSKTWYAENLTLQFSVFLFLCLLPI